VWIEFEEGDLDRPLWTGCAWAAPAFPYPVQVDPSGTVRIASVSELVLTAASVRVQAPFVKAEGIVEVSQLIASVGVISPSYTPGIGNLQ
jgi:hypothetical protein